MEYLTFKPEGENAATYVLHKSKINIKFFVDGNGDKWLSAIDEMGAVLKAPISSVSFLTEAEAAARLEQFKG